MTPINMLVELRWYRGPGTGETTPGYAALSRASQRITFHKFSSKEAEDRRYDSKDWGQKK